MKVLGFSNSGKVPGISGSKNVPGISKGGKVPGLSNGSSRVFKGGKASIKKIIGK